MFALYHNIVTDYLRARAGVIFASIGVSDWRPGFLRAAGITTYRRAVGANNGRPDGAALLARNKIRE